ncbi:uncharacterized protein G2W53_018564 [Senna tora]|uniref:Uncharacterized protein n=1 Tax=Senna tora TaxID=362788 RepID=A0A834TS07_9FABA|nr:uncharacterized protein G2W53_018564 [Senna tora]
MGKTLTCAQFLTKLESNEQLKALA